MQTSGSSSVTNLAVVEVRKNVESTTWYDAFLQDLVGDRAIVSFEKGVWSDREVPCSSVRARPDPDAEHLMSVSQLRAGDAVEVRVAASGRNPRGWALGRVLTNKDNYFYVALEGVKPGLDKDLILQADALRPVSQEQPLDPLYLFRRAVPIDEELRDWLTSLDARGCIEQVRQLTCLAHAGVGSDEHGVFTDPYEQRAPDSVILIGDEAAVRKANLLLQVHTMHQREVEAFHERRRHKLNLLKEVTARVGSAAATVSFSVDSDLIGLLMGKGGEHAKRVEMNCGVEVRVVENKDENGPKTVRILGQSDQAVEQAQKDLQLLRVEYPVDEDKIDWILGRGRTDVRDVGKEAGLVFAPKWNGRALELCGLRQCIEDAELLLDHLNDYFPIYQDMQQENDELQKSFEALDTVAVNAGLKPSKRRAESPNMKHRSDSPNSKLEGREKGADYQPVVQSNNAGDRGGGGGRGRGQRGGRRVGQHSSEGVPQKNVEDASSQAVGSQRANSGSDADRLRNGRGSSRRAIGEGNSDATAPRKVWRPRRAQDTTET